MQLYIFPPSPNSLRCQAAANQAGIELELIPVDLPTGGQMTPEFIKLNPNHKIPTLVDGDFSLWESSAIMLYLANKSPDSRQIPDDARQKAQMAQWMFWSVAHFGSVCGTFLFENVVKGMLNLGEPDPAVLESAGEEFHRFTTVLNDHVRGSDFAVGDSITLADHTWLPGWSTLK